MRHNALSYLHVLLKNNNVNINAQNNNGDTILHLAAQRANVSLIQVLLEREDINANIRNTDVKTPFACLPSYVDPLIFNLFYKRSAYVFV